jgi:hypothetical protein
MENILSNDIFAQGYCVDETSRQHGTTSGSRSARRHLSMLFSDIDRSTISPVKPIVAESVATAPSAHDAVIGEGLAVAEGVAVAAGEFIVAESIPISGKSVLVVAESVVAPVGTSESSADSGLASNAPPERPIEGEAPVAYTYYRGVKTAVVARPESSPEA